MNAADRMSLLVQDLLAYARLTTEDERPTSIALDEDLEAAITHLAQAIQESGARVTHDPMPNSRWIAARWFGCFRTWWAMR